MNAGAEEQRKNMAEIDIVQREADYVLYRGESPLALPDGREVATPHYRLAALLQREFESGDAARGGVSAWTIFSRQMGLPAGQVPARGPEERLVDDPLRARTGPAGEAVFSLTFASLLAMGQRLDAWLMEAGAPPFALLQHDDVACSRFFLAAEAALPAPMRAAAAVLDELHLSGLILPLLLVTGRITAGEYAAALLARRPECGGAATTALARWRQQALTAREYLECAPVADHDTLHEMIAGGESFNLEFKSTLSFNAHAGKKDPRLEHACLKSLCAFLNSDGGSLLIGVGDDGKVCGIEIDNFASVDKFSLHLWHLIRSAIGQDLAPFILTSFEKTEAGTVCLVRCGKSPRPVFLRYLPNEEEFYIRVGPASSRLSISEAMQHIRHHFQENAS